LPIDSSALLNVWNAVAAQMESLIQAHPRHARLIVGELARVLDPANLRRALAALERTNGKSRGSGTGDG